MDANADEAESPEQVCGWHLRRALQLRQQVNHSLATHHVDLWLWSSHKSLRIGSAHRVCAATSWTWRHVRRPLFSRKILQNPQKTKIINLIRQPTRTRAHRRRLKMIYIINKLYIIWYIAGEGSSATTPHWTLTETSWAVVSTTGGQAVAVSQRQRDTCGDSILTSKDDYVLFFFVNKQNI